MNHSDPKGHTPSSVLNEPHTDSFTRFAKDPRLDQSIAKKVFHKKEAAKNSFVTRILRNHDQEIFFDELRRYKREQIQDIVTAWEGDPLHNRQKILMRLSEVAKEILGAAYSFIKRDLEQVYGPACFPSSYEQQQPAHLAVVGMGKLGERSLNYYSDLDLVFVYSNRGETCGKKVIDNNEFFIKLARRIINALSLMTMEGRCYEIDTELRPSGNWGTLVTSYDHFIDHQMNKAQDWERQALIRARPLEDGEDFTNILKEQLHKLVYNRPLPMGFSKGMAAIREAVIAQRAKESDTRIDIKLGVGGLMDVEFIIHNCQLKYSPVYPDLCCNSLFACLEVLKGHDLFNGDDLKLLTEAHLYYRTVESQLHLIRKRSTSFVDWNSDDFHQVSRRMGFEPQVLKSDLLKFREEVRRIYRKVYS